MSFNGVSAYWFLAIKNINRRKMRSFLSALGILLGVAMIVSLVSVSDGLRKTTDDLTKTLGDTLLVVQKGVLGSVINSHVDEGDIDKIEKIPGVVVASPVLAVAADLEGYTPGNPLSGNLVGVIGTDPDKEKQMATSESKVVSGRDIKKGERGDVVLGAALVNGGGYKVGDTIHLTYRGQKYDYNVVGIYETGSSGADDTVVMDIDELRRMTGDTSRFVSMIYVLPSSPAQAELIERKIKILLPDTDPSYARSALATLNTFVSTLTLATWVIAGLAALIGGLGIANSMVMSVTERTKEIGILKAVGWLDNEIIYMIMAECLVISAAGAVMGIALGAIVSQGILPRLVGGGFSPTLTFGTILSAFLFAVALGLIGGIFPARHAASLDPVDAFKAE